MSPDDDDAAMPPSDVDLLGRFVSTRDMDSFTTILDRHQRDLLATAHGLLGDAHAAQDAVQEAFLRLCRDAQALLAKAGSRKDLGGWLATVMRNHCFDLLRRKRHAPLAASDLVADQGATPPEPDDDGAKAKLWEAVAALPGLERAAVMLRYRDGLSYQVIAERLGKTVTHVGVLLHQGLGRLRSRLWPHEELVP